MTVRSCSPRSVDTSEIERGDIITTHVSEYAIETYEQCSEEQVLVKRVIGIPGDRIVIDENGVMVNGAYIDEDYLTDEARAATYLSSGCNSVLLGEGEFYVLGDNRGVSLDSRYIGIIYAEDILYKQSTTPNSNFYLKLAFILAVLLLSICMCPLIEFIITECAWALIYGRKAREVSEKATSATHKDSEK